MSGVAALWWLDGRPARPQLERMVQLMAHRGPDGSGLWVDHSVGLGHAQLATTTEALRERQPLRHALAKHVLSMDGRVDNRPELLAALDRARLPAEPTDADLALSAYERWGEQLAAHLIGDFALALWDGERRRLICARDTAGVRPLYYHHRPGQCFAAASELAQLLSVPGLSRAPNEGMVGEYLAGDSVSLEDTLYRDVQRLRPGHLLVVTETRCVQRPYWRPDRIPVSKLQGDDTYAERFRHVFTRAVQDRARSRTPVASDLSGGLDSSSVSGILAGLRRQGGLTQPVHALSLAFPGLACDETHYACSVARQHPELGVRRVVVEPLPRADYAALARRHLDLPGYPNGIMGLPARQTARALGCGVVLTGVGSDELLSGSPMLDRALERWRDRAWRAGLRELRGGSPTVLLRGAVRRVLPPKPATALRRFNQRGSLPPWVRRDFVRRVELPARLLPSPYAPQGWSLARVHRLVRSTCNGWSVHALEIEERAAARLGLELRHPFCDRRLVELVLSFPEAQCRRGSWTKWVLRRALADVLPVEVRARRSKAFFTHTIAAALNQLPSFFPLSLRHTGWVDCSMAHARYAEARAPGAALGWPMWMLYAVHAWFQAHAEDP